MGVSVYALNKYYTFYASFSSKIVIGIVYKAVVPGNRARVKFTKKM